MSEFKREVRYFVFKIKHLTPEQIITVGKLFKDFKLPDLECLVVEHDWPIYEDVWAMIKAISEEKYTELDELRNNYSEARRICKEVCHSLGYDADAPMFCDMQSEVDALKAEAQRLKVDLMHAKLDGAKEYHDYLLGSVKSIFRPHLEGVFSVFKLKPKGGK